MSEGDLQDRLARLREEFDAAFALPRPAAPAPATELLHVRAGDARFALRLAALSWVGPVRRVVRVPGTRSELAGLSVLRGRVVAVFDLGRLTSRPGATIAFVGVTRADPDVAIGFSAIEARSAVSDERMPTDTRDEITNLIPGDWGTRELVSIPGLLRRIRAGAMEESS